MHAVIWSGYRAGTAGPDPRNRRLCGLSLVERHIRTLHAAGVTSISVLAADPLVEVESRQARARGIELDIVAPQTRFGDWLDKVGETQARVVIVDMNYLIDPVLVRAVLQAKPPTILVDTEAPPPSRDGSHRLVEFNDAPDPLTDSDSAAYFCGILSLDLNAAQLTAVDSLNELVSLLLRSEPVRRLDVADLPTFQPDIRRKRRPIWMRCHNRSQLKLAKQAVIAAAQKGSLDWPAQWIHAPLENSVVTRICEASITPNQLTLITNIAAWTVTWLLLNGHILAGLMGAAVVGVLDGMDGKLARVKLMTSKIGEYEHVFDLLFEYSWWLALGWSLSGGDVTSSVFTAAIVLVLCNFGDSMATVSFLYWRGRHVGRTLDNYTRTDYLIRKVAGRRNVYIWFMLLGALFTDAVTAFYAATVWAVITCVVRGTRALMHMATPLVERPVDDFLG